MPCDMRKVQLFLRLRSIDFISNCNCSNLLNSITETLNYNDVNNMISNRLNVINTADCSNLIDYGLLCGRSVHCLAHDKDCCRSRTDYATGVLAKQTRLSLSNPCLPNCLFRASPFRVLASGGGFGGGPVMKFVNCV